MITLETDAVSWLDLSDGLRLTIRTPDAKRIASEIKKKQKYTVEIKEYRQKRSLDQNALYWKILSQFAKALDMSNNWAHNYMLRRYGEPERYGDQLVRVVLPDTVEAEEQANDAETYHLKPTAQTRTEYDGKQYRTYILMRGSSTYNTSEMRRLIDGLLQECNDIGLDVISERERALLNEE